MAAPTVGKKIAGVQRRDDGRAQVVQQRPARAGLMSCTSIRRTTRRAARSKARIFATGTPSSASSSVRVLGVSRDSLASHAKFQGKYALPFELISDADEKLCQQFDVIKEKNMYGKKVLGIERSTFLVDADGRLAQGVA